MSPQIDSAIPLILFCVDFPAEFDTFIVMCEQFAKSANELAKFNMSRFKATCSIFSHFRDTFNSQAFFLYLKLYWELSLTNFYQCFCKVILSLIPKLHWPSKMLLEVYHLQSLCPYLEFFHWYGLRGYTIQLRTFYISADVQTCLKLVIWNCFAFRHFFIWLQPPFLLM